MRPALKADGSEYYEYILLYTDDILSVGEDAERVFREEIGRYFELKERSIGPPKIYLGSNVRKVELEMVLELGLSILRRMFKLQFRTCKIICRSVLRLATRDTRCRGERLPQSSLLIGMSLM